MNNDKTQMQTMMLSGLSAVRTAETNHVNVILMAHILTDTAKATATTKNTNIQQRHQQSAALNMFLLGCVQPRTASLFCFPLSPFLIYFHIFRGGDTFAISIFPPQMTEKTLQKHRFKS